MTPEAARFMDAARQHLAHAMAVATLGIDEIAGREAYLAAFHAAEAILHDRTGRVVKTHRGLRTEFARLARDEPAIDPTCTKFLAEAYEITSLADYGTDPKVIISSEQTATAIQSARRFIECIAALLGPEEPTVP